MTLLPPLRGAQHLAPCQAPREETESPDKASELEPVSGFEPLTCRLQEACPGAIRPLPAPMPYESALAAPKTRVFPGDPFHDPFHVAALALAPLNLIVALRRPRGRVVLTVHAARGDAWD